MTKPINPFRFKQFMVHQNHASMKVGTDAVLLGAWADLNNVSTALDIGTGTGVIALMLAQRSKPEIKIDAVDVEKKSVMEAAENIARSPWPEKIITHHIAIQEFFPSYAYDLVVSNPPYFVNSLLPPAMHRQDVRHTKSLSHLDLLTAAGRLLKPTGRLAIILPTTEGNQFQALAGTTGLFCTRRAAFFSRQSKPQERWLMEFSFTQTDRIDERLWLYDEGNRWSEDYWLLTRDFYLVRPPA